MLVTQQGSLTVQCGRSGLGRHLRVACWAAELFVLSLSFPKQEYLSGGTGKLWEPER